jgi:glyoxylase-like metal-dependent hydrolase (beta-lactamase superfamily II)
MSNTAAAGRLRLRAFAPIIPAVAISRSPMAGVELASKAGIRPLAVCTPFAVGSVNVYLVENETPALVDCGPNSATSLRDLERGLGAYGYSLSDIALVFVTHQHMDHMGLAGVVAERAGAEVACLGLLAPYLEDWDTWAAADDDLAYEVMLRHGLDPSTAKALRSVARMVRGWGASVTVDRPLRDGDSLPLAGRMLRVLHRPGHSPSDTVVYDEEHRVLITGDHLLPRVSSNALISRPLDGEPGGQRARPLLQYRASLRATRALDAEVTLGGHGEPILDHHALIDKRLRLQDERAAELLRLLSDGPRSAHELAGSLWGGDVAITQAFLTLSEVLGHLDLLIDEGLAAEDDSGSVVRFEAL